MGGVVVETICVLVGVCALATVILRWGGQRFAGGNADAPMRVIGRLPLEPKRALLVVRVGERTMMLASSEAGVHPVGELSADETWSLQQAMQRSSRHVSRETSEAA